ncbi:MAG: transposase [Thermoleophilaceae bacterium]
MGEVFGLSISEGALSNILARAQTPLLAATAPIAAAVTASRVVCRDETSARVRARPGGNGSSCGTLAVLHLIRPSRGTAVRADLFGAIRPDVWVSDMLGSQRGHGQNWQMCLAHLLRDAQYAIECGDQAFSAAAAAPAAARHRHRAAARDAEGHHPRAISRRPRPPARPDHGLHAHGRAGEQAAPPHRAQTARTCSSSSPTATCRPPTTSPSERSGPSVIFRKVTNGFRCRVGRRNLRRLPLRRQHRKAGRANRSGRDPGGTGWS